MALRPALPTRIADYQVLALLGSGASGDVLRVADPAGRQLALKLLSAAASSERFEREGRVTAALRHPGIVRIHGAGSWQQRPFLVYELIDGQDLEACFDRLARPDLLRIVLKSAEALGYAHSQGVVHRDVKPANLLVDRAGQVHVADFGMAQAVGYERLTQSGALVGTPHYMAPEQVVGARDKYGPPTDVWALGVLLYRALTGSEPFQADSMVALIAQVAGKPARDPREIEPRTSRGLAEVALRALQKHAPDRYPNATAFADDLRLALEGHSVEGLRPLVRSRPLRVPALVVGMLLAASAAGWLLTRKQAEVPLPAPSAPASAASRDDGSTAHLADVFARLENGDEAAARTSYNDLLSVVGTTEARSRVLAALESNATPERLERHWPLLEWVSALPADGPPRPMLPTLTEAAVEVVRRGVKAKDNLDLEQVCDRLKTLADLGLRLENRELGQRTMDPLTLRWSTMSIDPALYWRCLLSAVRLDFALHSDHFDPKGPNSSGDQPPPWGSAPRDPWERFVDLRVREEDTTSEGLRERILQAISDPASFGGPSWELGPWQWNSVALRVVKAGYFKRSGHDRETCERLIAQLLERTPDDPRVHYACARWTQSYGVATEVEEASRRGLELFDSTYSLKDPLRRSLGIDLLHVRTVACVDLQRWAEARSCFERVRAISQDAARNLAKKVPTLLGR